MHPLLQEIYNGGGEIKNAMEVFIKTGDGIERTVLDVTYKSEKITYKLEDNRQKPTGHNLDPAQGGLVEAYEPKWRVHFSYVDKDDTLQSGLAMIIGDEEEDEGDVLSQSRRIANEIQEIYGLPYEVEVLRDGQKVA